jgi:fibro-slime domain-containing protein
MHKSRAHETYFAAPLILSFFAACGARTALGICTQPGETRACENACGTGSQACVGDQWQRCIVPVAVRGCSNACGSGSQTCAEGVWSACDVPEAQRSCSSRCGPGQEKCVDGGWQPCDAPQPGPPTFTATVRDFTRSHPDFEPDGGGIPQRGGLDRGIVAPDLGPDDKPVYAGAPTTPSTHGAAYFNEWYRDTPPYMPTNMPITMPINMSTSLSIPLAPTPADPSVYEFDDEAFFPIDGRLFGNEGQIHNYDFTVEFLAHFHYAGGEIFRFSSDDDSWVFLNRKLALDLGGVHQNTGGSIDLDLQSQTLGIVKGGTYPLHLFYAERHVVGAVLRIDVPAPDFAVCAGEMP